MIHYAPLILVIGLIAGMCFAHTIARRIPHRPDKREVQQVRRELATDAYSSLLKSDDDDEQPEYNVTVWSDDGYKDMRKRKLSDWILP